jgi:hypothetical protein
MKRIAYIAPVNWMRGKLAGNQDLKYNGVDAYSVAVGEEIRAEDYRSIVIAKVLREPYRDRLRFFQVRTRSTVNMTATMHRNLALMGGAGAIFAALLRQKESVIYINCVSACPKGMTLRAFITPLLRAGLAAKEEHISIADNVFIVNPWVTSETPNVPVPAEVLSKFSDELSND